MEIVNFSRQDTFC